MGVFDCMEAELNGRMGREQRVRSECEEYLWRFRIAWFPFVAVLVNVFLEVVV